MADNKIDITDSLTPYEKPLPSTNAPQPAVSTSSVSNPDEKSVLMANDGNSPLNYSAFPVPSAPNPDDLPPNYFDISVVPNDAVLFYNQVPPQTNPSVVVADRKTDGVHSFDPSLDRNPDNLWHYFMTYLNEKPELNIQVHGYYTRHYTTFDTYRKSDGCEEIRTTEHSETITDFNFTLDASNYISQQWWRVAVVPSSKTVKAGEFVSLRDALEQYTLSTKNFKEITCQKQLAGWDFTQVGNHIRAMIYSTGYQNKIDVKFTLKNKEIVARSSSNISRFASSTLVRVLCVISCLWIIFGPIYLCLRASGSTKDQIVADYTMVTSSDIFLRLNYGLIVTAARSYSKEHLTAYLQ